MAQRPTALVIRLFDSGILLALVNRRDQSERQRTFYLLLGGHGHVPLGWLVFEGTVGSNRKPTDLLKRNSQYSKALEQ